MSKAEAPVRVFAALGDPTRLALLERLSERSPSSITDLAAGSEITRQAVTKHLEVLESAGLVSRAKEGRQSLFEYRAEPVADARAYLDAVGARWDEALARLKALVEE